MSEVTRILSQIDQGDSQAMEKLLPLVYDELRTLAASKMAQEKPGQTLQATALVHEAYLRLVVGPDSQSWENRGHFFAAAAQAMRRILVEIARKKHRVKHGGEFRRVAEIEHQAFASSGDVVALDEALNRLATEDPLAAKVVELRHFTGLGHEAVAHTLAITVYQARQKWTYARAWLRTALGETS